MNNRSETGKPIMIWDLVDLGLGNLYFYDLLIQDNTLWFPWFQKGCICKADLKNKTFEIIDNFKIDFEGIDNLLMGIKKINNKLLLAKNGYSDRFVVYDIDKKIFYEEKINRVLDNVVDFRHDEVFSYQNRIYIVLRYTCIIKCDETLHDMQYIELPFDDCQFKMHGQVLQKENELYIPIGNSLYKFDMEIEKWEKVFSDNTIGNIWTLCFDGKDYWMTTNDNRLIQWGENVSCYEITASFNALVSGTVIKNFYRSYYNEKCIWLIPAYTDSIIKIDTISKHMEIFIIEGEEENNDTISRPGRKNKAKYIAVEKHDSELLLLSSKTEKLYHLNMSTKQAKEIIFKHKVNNKTAEYKMDNLKLLIESIIYLQND